MERKQRLRPSNAHPSLSNRNKAKEKKDSNPNIGCAQHFRFAQRHASGNNPIYVQFTHFHRRMLQRQCKSRKLIVALCLREKFIFYYSIFLGVFSLNGNVTGTAKLQNCNSLVTDFFVRVLYSVAVRVPLSFMHW